ncbi:RNA polymerase I-specific transcription initiation factor RRN3 [Rhizodiscina lignyota]|uniref:RNA polymerase I-specific transcription initiation factor RRN3 n=1 Tax=Rhizodiscina lignyota TaxID=1504668 RepID=A0A9P4I5L6_9PEZI|nr:RNA polymerase I-specific transcription initiation factor RRN3 [Rhizodiscina lignyota]
MATVAIKSPSAGVMATPPATDLKRKRVEPESSGLDDTITSSQILSSPTKRLKVTFNPEIDVRVVEDWRDKAIGLVREEVRTGIDGHITGTNSARYDQIKQFFAASPSAKDALSSRLLRKYLIALIGCIRSLDKRCNGLVHAVVDSAWLERDDEFIAMYLRLLGALVSAHGGYIHEVLSMLVSKFTSLSSPEDELQDQASIERPRVFDRVHQALKYLNTLIPSASATLFKVLADSFPYSTSSKQVHIDFVSNMLRIPSYAPEMRNGILGLAIDRVVKIDVQLQKDAEFLQDEFDTIMRQIIQKRQEKLRNNGELSDPEDSDDSDDESEDEFELDTDEKRIIHLKESVHKLDELMDLLFNFYHPIFTKGSNFEIDEAFDHMMTQFKRTILPVFQARYTQFLIFHFAQSSPRLMDRFVATCLDVLTDPTRPDYIRLAAASYVASFVSRSKRASSDIVLHTVRYLCIDLESFRDKHEHHNSVADPHRFPTYYFIAQAIIYIFCFRWRMFMDLDEDEDDEFIENVVFGYERPRWISPMRQLITRNICCRLNPLKVCAPEIVEQFNKLATALQFTTATSLIAANKRLRISRPTVEAIAGYGAREAGMSGGLNEMFQLEAFFPFDPYHLPQSRKWLESDYIEWTPPPGVQLDVDEEDERETSEERH